MSKRPHKGSHIQSERIKNERRGAGDGSPSFLLFTPRPREYASATSLYFTTFEQPDTRENVILCGK